MKIDITGLRKPLVLAALYNVARPQGLGFLHYDPKPMSEEEAIEALKQTTYFNYWKGRVMKVDLSGNTEFDSRLFDRDNGDGAALIAITAVREGTVTSPLVEKVHEEGKLNAAAHAKESLNGPPSRLTGEHEGMATFTLGMDPEIKEALAPAIDKALEK